MSCGTGFEMSQVLDADTILLIIAEAFICLHSVSYYDQSASRIGAAECRNLLSSYCFSPSVHQDFYGRSRGYRLANWITLGT